MRSLINEVRFNHYLTRAATAAAAADGNPLHPAGLAGHAPAARLRVGGTHRRRDRAGERLPRSCCWTWRPASAATCFRMIRRSCSPTWQPRASVTALPSSDLAASSTIIPSRLSGWPRWARLRQRGRRKRAPGSRTECRAHRRPFSSVTSRASGKWTPCAFSSPNSSPARRPCATREVRRRGVRREAVMASAILAALIRRRAAGAHIPAAAPASGRRVRRGDRPGARPGAGPHGARGPADDDAAEPRRRRPRHRRPRQRRPAERSGGTDDRVDQRRGPGPPRQRGLPLAWPGGR